MSSHNKGPQIQGDFCVMHLRYVVSCADAEIERALASLPAYDLARLRKAVAKPVKRPAPEPEQKAS